MNSNWKSTCDIDNVMTNIEHNYENFKYLGTYPIDFDELDMFKIDLEFLFEQYQKIAMIINLADHTSNGTQWVAIYVDQNKLFYFDPYCGKIGSRITKYINKIKKHIGKPIDTIYNEHIYNDHDSGALCIHFILKQLKS